MLEALEKIRTRLLDLSGRNALLNYRHPKKSTLRIIDELPNQIFDRLSQDKAFTIIPVPKPSEKELEHAGFVSIDESSGEKIIEMPDAQEWAKHLELSTRYEVPTENSENTQDKHADEYLQTMFYPQDLEAVLNNIYSKYNSTIQETGANMLSLCLGFLEWYESDDSDKVRIAPLIMLPVAFERSTPVLGDLFYKYDIKRSPDDIAHNLCLSEKLRKDFGIVLPTLESTDEGFETPEEYFEKFAPILKAKPKWRIRRYVSLGLVQFQKLLMYLDLDPNNWGHTAEGTPISNYFADKPVEERGSNLYAETYEIDSKPENFSNHPLIFDADSSQHSAVIDSVSGKSFIIEGPPGTGKSQTISNIIGCALEKGKTILFICEKLAALQVVEKKLSSIGLGVYTFNVHSNAMKKASIIDDIRERLQYQPPSAMTSQLQNTLSELEIIKMALNDYSDVMVADFGSIEKTVGNILFDTAVLMAQCDNKELPNLPFPETVTDVNEIKLNKYRAALASLANEYKKLNAENGLPMHPWFGTTNTNITTLDHSTISHQLQQWIHALTNFNKRLSDFDFFRQGIHDFTVIDLVKLYAALKDIDSIDEDRWQFFCAASQDKVSLKQLVSFYKDLSEVSKAHTYAANSMKIDVPVDELFATSLDTVISNITKTITKHKSLEVSRLTMFNESISIMRDCDLTGVISQLNEVLEFDFKYCIHDTETASQLIKHVASLDEYLVNKRNERMVSDSYKEVLATLKQQLTLHKQSAELCAPYIKLDAPIDSTRAKQILVSIKNANLFSFLDNEYRRATKEIKAHLLVKLKKKDLCAALDNFIELRNLEERISANKEYSRTLGDLFTGLDTEVDDLIALQTWHANTVKAFGHGYGPTSKLTEKLFTINDSKFLSLYGLTTKNVANQMDACIDAAKFMVSCGVNIDAHTELNSNSVTKHYAVADDIGLLLKLSSNNEHDRETLFKVAETLKQANDSYKRSTEISASQYSIDSIWNKALQSQLKTFLKTASALYKSDYAFPSDSRPSQFTSFRDNLSSLLKANKQAQDDFCETIKPKDWVRDATTIGETITRCNLAKNSIHALDDYVAYLLHRKDCLDMNLAPIVKEFEAGFDDAQHLLLTWFYYQLSKAINQKYPELSKVTGNEQEQLVKRFKVLDVQLIEQHRSHIANCTSKRSVPNGRKSSRVKELYAVTLNSYRQPTSLMR